MGDNQMFDVIVVGGGPAGRACAVALAAANVRTALVAPPLEPAQETRTTALLAGSVAALREVGAWERMAPFAAPLRTMRIVDDTRRLVRAPTVDFRCEEIDLDAFGWNVANRDIVGALAERGAELAHLVVHDSPATEIVPGDDDVAITLADGSRLRGRLVAGADGRRSLAREAAGIAVEARGYPQVAVTANFSHARPHDDISTEFHTETGPCTLVPLTGNRSSLVCVVRPAEADALMALDEAAFARAIVKRVHAVLGGMTLEGPRGRWPLGVETARTFAARRIALVGEAAHVIPPIGAQGLNLGLRDATTLAEIAAGAIRAGGDPGGSAVLADYDRRRRIDIGTRTVAVDILNRSLLSDFLPVAAMRSLGMAVLDRIGPLRRAVMREGVAPRFG